MLKITTVGRVMIPMSDQDEAIEFYTKTLVFFCWIAAAQQQAIPPACCGAAAPRHCTESRCLADERRRKGGFSRVSLPGDTPGSRSAASNPADLGGTGAVGAVAVMDFRYPLPGVCYVTPC
jgi:hypothetical protein